MNPGWEGQKLPQRGHQLHFVLPARLRLPAQDTRSPHFLCSASAKPTAQLPAEQSPASLETITAKTMPEAKAYFNLSVIWITLIMRNTTLFQH